MFLLLIPVVDLGVIALVNTEWHNLTEDLEPCRGDFEVDGSRLVAKAEAWGLLDRESSDGSWRTCGRRATGCDLHSAVISRR